MSFPIQLRLALGIKYRPRFHVKQICFSSWKLLGISHDMDTIRV